MIKIVFVIIIAYILDLIVGDPSWFYHPVIAIGRLISFLEKRVKKRMDTKLGGVFIVLPTLITVFLVMYFSSHLLFKIQIIGLLFSIISLCTCFATKSLAKESLKVKTPLDVGDMDKARLYLSYIVGRETKNLEKKDIIRATVETVAENTVDGIISPMFYAFVGLIIGYIIGGFDIGTYGAPTNTDYGSMIWNLSNGVHGDKYYYGLFHLNNKEVSSIVWAVVLSMIYKAINTMDSMIGYKNEKYINIGMVAARLDDVANYIPARLSVLFFAVASVICKYDCKSCIKIAIRDRKNHKSPNCAYPEGSVAGALGIRLGGDNVYFGEVVKKPTIGDKKRNIEIEDINRSIKLMYISSVISILFLGILSTVIIKSL